MKSCRLRYVWLVAIVGLAACATETTGDTAQAGTSTTVATTTAVEDSVGPTTSVAESVASTVASAETSASKLRPLGLPGMSLNEPAGEYGWTSGSGKSGWMHRVAANGQIQLVFGVSADCFHTGGDPAAVTVAGLDGLYVEPYEGSTVTFIGRRAGETTGAYALPIGDRTLCVYLTWDPAITPDQLSAAREVVESIRGEPHGEDGIRINFYLEGGWDTG